MADQNGQAPTERVVLELTSFTTGREPKEDVVEAWVVVGTAQHSDKAAAIKSVVGDTPGKYRAPSLRAWKGGLEISLPEKPKPETKVFD